MPPRIDHCSPHRSSHARIDHRSPQRSYYLAGRFRLIIWPIFLTPTQAALALPRSQPEGESPCQFFLRASTAPTRHMAQLLRASGLHC